LRNAQYLRDLLQKQAFLRDFSNKSASNVVTGCFARSFLSQIVMFQQKHLAGQLDRLEN